MFSVLEATFDELTPRQLYAILRLRSEVFVVEQECVYLDLDGVDTTPNVRHIWVEQDRRIIAVVRLIDDGLRRHIGRVATAADARGRGLAGKLIDYCLATSEGPWALAAQSHLAGWYSGFGFAIDGDEYLEDGIPHVPMTRP